MLEATKDYLSGFRMPDFQKLWNGQDQVDLAKKPKPFLVRIERHLVQLQELSLWTNPKNSLMALVILHLVYWYLSVTSNSPVYLMSTAALISFVYTTWTQRIWPEIRVPDANPGPEPDWTPVNPDVLSAPELVKLFDEAKAKGTQLYQWSRDLRAREPGKFCLGMSSIFICMAYLGSSLTALGLFYYLSVGYLLVPGALKVLVKYPAVQCMLETMNEYRREDQVDQAKEETPKVAQEEPAAPSLVTSVYSTLQSGLEAVSNLNLKSEIAAIKETDDDLKSYLPEEDEANQSILESAINNSNTRDPTQAHNLDHEEIADSSLEYASLLPVMGDVMPHDDDLDVGPSDAPNVQAPLDVEEEEFLPSQPRHSRPLDTDDNDDEEFAVSLMAAAASEQDNARMEEPDPIVAAPVMSSRRKSSTSSGESNIMDDFELISEEELALASP